MYFVLSTSGAVIICGCQTSRNRLGKFATNRSFMEAVDKSLIGSVPTSSYPNAGMGR